MKSCALVSKNGQMTDAGGLQPADAPQFATGTEVLLLKQRLVAEQNIRLIRSRLAEATRR